MKQKQTTNNTNINMHINKKHTFSKRKSNNTAYKNQRTKPHATDCGLGYAHSGWSLESGSLESGSLEAGSLESGNVESHAKHFGLGYAHHGF